MISFVILNTFYGITERLHEEISVRTRAGSMKYALKENSIK